MRIYGDLMHFILPHDYSLHGLSKKPQHPLSFDVYCSNHAKCFGLVALFIIVKYDNV